MSRTVQCCPTCDSTELHARTGAYDYEQIIAPEDRWRCYDCGDTFPAPSERLAYQPPGYSGMTACLLAIDPDATIE